jgi:hypothetical protein
VKWYPTPYVPAELQEAISARLQETDGITLATVIEEMESRGPTKTLRDFFQGEHFSAGRGGWDGTPVCFASYHMLLPAMRCYDIIKPRKSL